jgi:hypothetical protein
MVKRLKISTALGYSLAIISIIGFLGIIASVFAGFDFITENTAGIILVVLGFGLAVEGQIKKWRDFKGDGYSSTEITHVITGLLGIIAVFTGLLSLIGLSGKTLLALQGIISVIAVVIIILQTWVVE